uniref:Uncharacterized protein n=1 Tax=Seriola lalandi dorsalis TaxID=1841481 RepID=A0A3B4X4K1_SERLL
EEMICILHCTLYFLPPGRSVHVVSLSPAEVHQMSCGVRGGQDVGCIVWSLTDKEASAMDQHTDHTEDQLNYVLTDAANNKYTKPFTISCHPNEDFLLTIKKTTGKLKDRSLRHTVYINGT